MWQQPAPPYAPPTVGHPMQPPLGFTSTLVPGVVIGVVGFPFVLALRSLLLKAFGSSSEVDVNIIYPLVGSALLSLGSALYIAIWYRRIAGSQLPFEATAGIGFGALMVSFVLAISLKKVFGAPDKKRPSGKSPEKTLKLPVMHQDLKQE